MELIVLNTTLARTKVLDVFRSLIWTDRYDSFGDFELLVDASVNAIQTLQEDFYLTLYESEHLMVIESVELKTDVENGNKFFVKGRSAETILERRIIWNQTVLNGNLQEGIKNLIDQNAIAPSDTDRKIDNLVFEYSTDPAVTALGVNVQYSGDNLYEAVAALCVSNNIGFKITLNSANQFVFKLYAGIDRSYDQIANPFVEFSPELDNLSNTNYSHSKRPFRSVTLVGGEGEGSARKSTTVSLPGGGGTGLSRREKFTDASSVSSLVNGVTISEGAYISLLTTEGLISLLESLPVSSFDGKVDYGITYIYGEDFFMGDLVQVVNEYGLGSRARVMELIFSEDLSGRDIYPTFKMVE
jgi:hypothetical protein